MFGKGSYEALSIFASNDLTGSFGSSGLLGTVLVKSSVMPKKRFSAEQIVTLLRQISATTGPDSGDRHQASADLIVPHDGQQTAVQDTELLVKHPPNNEKRFDQKCAAGQG